MRYGAVALPHAAPAYSLTDASGTPMVVVPSLTMPGIHRSPITAILNAQTPADAAAANSDAQTALQIAQAQEQTANDQLAIAQAADTMAPVPAAAGLFDTMGTWLWVVGGVAALGMVVLGFALTSSPKKPPLSGHRRRRRSRR